jgi:hypothetical protein
MSTDAQPRRWRRTAAPVLRSTAGGFSDVPFTLNLAFLAAVAQLYVSCEDRPMNKPEALELARTLLRPSRALGYLVTRGPGWPPLEKCGEYKRAVGGVLGNAYCLLQPIWDEHPDLDPGAHDNADPVGLDTEPMPPETSPAGLLPYIDATERAANLAVNRMLEDASISRHKGFIEASAQDLRETIASAKQTLIGNDKKS